jgi:hypothetical protein
MIDRCRRLPIAVALGLATLLCGCVERRMTIRSNPPGATVYVDDYPDPIGITPASANFTYYGTRKIRLVKDGYETLTVLQPMYAPWYEWFGVDLVSENLVPGEIRDQQQFSYQLRPQAVIPGEQLLGRAQQLRQGAQTATLPAPMSPGGPPVVPPGTGILPPPGEGGSWTPLDTPVLPPTPGVQSFAPPPGR